jgi:hypothetical protein
LPTQIITSSLLCIHIFFVKALRQWRQGSGEAFNAGKKIEAMKRLTLHHIASSLYRFIALSLYRFIVLLLHRFIASSLYCFIALLLQLFIAS